MVSEHLFVSRRDEPAVRLAVRGEPPAVNGREHHREVDQHRGGREHVRSLVEFCERVRGSCRDVETWPHPVGLWDGRASSVPQGPCIGFEEATCRRADGPSAKVRVAEQEWRRRGYKA